jgi:hypothetical protein
VGCEFVLFVPGIVPGADVLEFVSPDAPHRADPRYDMDLASYSIVRTVWADDTDPANGWRWEPKPAFHALARQFAARTDERGSGRPDRHQGRLGA